MWNDNDEHDSDDDTTDDEDEETSQLSSHPSLQISPRAIAIAPSLLKLLCHKYETVLLLLTFKWVVTNT